MSIDTRNKRASALREGLLPLPDASPLDEGDRQQVLWQYRGIAAGPIIPVIVQAGGITDIRAYSALGTDNEPVFLARDTTNRIYSSKRIILDSGSSGTQVGKLTGASQGAFMIPYRPNQSPQSWMYVASQQDYRKYSAPDISTGLVTEFLTGIEEQQNPPEVCPNIFGFTDYFGFAAAWSAGGTAAAASNSQRVNDTAGTSLQDPASDTAPNSRWSVQVSSTVQYQVGMNILVGGTSNVVVQDVLPAVNQGVAITIEGIYYLSGTTGRCVIVPTQGPVASPFQSATDPTASIYAPAPLSALRRGSIVVLNGGAGTEKLFVLSSTVGPLGTICFEVVTSLAFVAGDSVTGVPAISVSGFASSISGQALTCPDITFTMTTGTATQSEGLAESPFNIINSANGVTTQQYDYVGVAINISDLTLLTSIRFIWNIGLTVNYTQNAFYTELTSADFTSQVDGVLPASQYFQFLIPITNLIRIGSDSALTLSDTNGIRVEVVSTGALTVRFGRFWVGVGNQPDVGQTGSPYFYAVRTRSSLTGASSNPSPVTRYGVGPRRQSVRITMQDTNSDNQDDLWDIFRQGGSVNTMRYIGTTLNTGGVDVFTDNYFDTAALGGSLIEYDNFQPWPSIDLPFTVQWGGGDGVTITISVVGTVIMLVYSSAERFVSPAPANILRWLPGTLMTINGLTAVTLWNRPQLVTLASPPNTYYYAYRFRIVENAGVVNPTILQVNEPNIANEPLPYLWGPDAEGTVFAAGDPLRPGTVYFCKSFTPDSAPDSYNQEITPPSEPLMGGEAINGVSYLASTERWWALIPSFSTTTRYQKVEQPVGRGLVAPYARCTDGRVIYFVAKDGIWTTSGQNLTDEDLHNLFPHDGVPGQDYVYGTRTIPAPDYKNASMFRLCYKNAYLYFDYRDTQGLPHTLVCDLRDPSNPAWSLDVYGDPIGVHYGVEQQAGTLLSSAQDSSNYPALVMGDDNGLIHIQKDLANDNGTPIPCAVATFEFNGGDIRGDQLYNDEFLDLIPAAIDGVVATPLQGGAAAQAPTTIPSSFFRIQTNVPIGLEMKSMGILLEWTDNYNRQNVATLLRSWQPMFQPTPISVFRWTNQGTTFGLSGYKHLPWALIAYKAEQDVVLTITVYDGTSPDPIILPATFGELRKTLFTFTPNKGMIYTITGDSPGQWKLYNDECEFYVGAWSRPGQYLLIRDIDAPAGIGG